MNSKDTDLITNAVVCLGYSLVNCYAFFGLTKRNELTDKKKARQRYCQSVCLFFGAIAPAMQRQSDNEIVEFMQMAVHLFNNSMKKFHKNLFYGLDLEPNSQGGFSELNAEIGRWFLENMSTPIISAIVETGTHMMASTYDGNKINKKTLNQFNKMGSLFSIEDKPIDGLRIILVDNSFKTNF
tara:strand:- start:381 stop:929 length:549 start_codon:yes stop_codon:yes gene_type:complete